MSRTAPKARDFGALAELKLKLQTAQREAAQRAAREAERLAREQHERELFARSVGRVADLRKSAPPLLARTQPAPIPRQRQRDEAAVLVESISDGIDAISLLETDATLSFRRAGIDADVVRRLRRGQWAIQAQLDLHGLRRDGAREQLLDFLRDAGAQGLRCVRIVHGKGNGSPGREPVLKAKVRHWLQQKSEVMAYAQARACDGGHGALIVLLRPAPRREAPSRD
ncbi:MAG: Smr/MutS family protein [Burkholderiaceae bacterium]